MDSFTLKAARLLGDLTVKVPPTLPIRGTGEIPPVLVEPVEDLIPIEKITDEHLKGRMVGTSAVEQAWENVPASSRQWKKREENEGR